MDHDGSIPPASSEMAGVVGLLEPDRHCNFAHPAGLEIARYMTSLVIEAVGVHMWRETDGAFHFTAPERNDSELPIDAKDLMDPEAMAELQSILAFQSVHDTGSDNGKNLTNSASGSGDGRQDQRYDSPTPTPASTPKIDEQQYGTRPLICDLTTPEPVKFSVVSRTPSPDLPPSGFYLSRTNTSHPQTQQSGTLPGASSFQQHSRDTTIRNASAPRLPSLPSPLNPTKSAQFSTSSQSSSSFPLPKIDLPPIDRSTMGQSNLSINCQPLPSIAAADNISHVPFNGSYNIKSFLPVNKTMDNTNAAGKPLSIPIPSSNLSSFRVDEQSRRTSFQHPQIPTNKQTASSHTKQTTADKYSLTASSMGPSQSTHTAQFFSQTTYDHSTGSYSTTTMKNTADKSVSKKRKSKEVPGTGLKRQKLDKKGRSTKLKESDLVERTAQECVNDDIWMRIFEFTPPAFLKKARLVCRSWKGMVDEFDSIFVNCRKENYGWDMPTAPEGMSERQYSDLLGGKGCQEPDCDNKKATRTYWSWSKRWCADCWEKSIEREDRILKNRQNQFTRSTVMKMLEAIPVAIHDSFVKPHDYTEEVEIRARGPPRLYKCYLIKDVDAIIEEYNALEPPAHVPNPEHTPAEASAALDAHKALMDALEEKRNVFFAARKEANDKHMERVKKIEAAIRKKRMEERAPKDKARKGRIELFTRRAGEDLPHIDIQFVKSTKAFKAACRIYRDGGTERGWRALKPKIEKEWSERDLTAKAPNGGQPKLHGVSMDDDSVIDDMEFSSSRSTPGLDVGGSTQQQQHQQQHQHQHHGQHRPQTYYGSMQQHMGARPNHPLRQSADSSTISHIGYNNPYGGNGGSFSYSTAHMGNTLGQASRSSLPFPTQSMMGNISAPQRSLPPPTNFLTARPQQYPAFGLGNNFPLGFHHQQPHATSQNTHIPINSLLGPSTPAPHHKHNQYQ